MQAASGLPAVQILMDCGDYALGNLGDVAMLQVAVLRLREALPEAVVGVVTHDPRALALHCPQAVPVPLLGRDYWLGRGTLLGRADRLLHRAPLLGNWGIEGALRHRAPSLFTSLVRARIARDEAARGSFDHFVGALACADAVVLCGAGGITDHARTWAMSVLELFEGAIARGAATAMFGHGLGPLSDRDLREAAGRVLPRLDTFALREGRAGPDLARELGVPDARVMVTGDDAIEPAYAARAAMPGSAIGVNLRVARSAGVDDSYIAPVAQSVREFAGDLGAPLLGIPIGRGRASNDNATIERLLADYGGGADDGSGLDTTDKVIAQVRRCRVVVTGAYHAAVFALAQGIPTVCLARSAYFSDKMQGLAQQFPAGCTVVDLGAPDIAVRLDTAMRHAWQHAEGVRAGLLGSAERQIAASRAAYARFADIVRARAARAAAEASPTDRGGSRRRTSDPRTSAQVAAS